MQGPKITLSFLLLPFMTLADPCTQIVQKIAPKRPTPITIKAYLKAQKDIQGKSTLDSPVNAGIKIEVPLYDPKEKFQLQKEYLQSLNFARKLLADYLSLRYEVEEMKKYIKWQWKRVQAGIEYRKDIWKEQIQLKQKQGQLQALKTLLISAGVKEKELEKCYKYTLKEEENQ